MFSLTILRFYLFHSIGHVVKLNDKYYAFEGGSQTTFYDGLHVVASGIAPVSCNGGLVVASASSTSSAMLADVGSVDFFIPTRR